MNKPNYKGMLKSYQREYARIRRADLQEAARAYNVYNQKHEDEFLNAFNENLKEEAHERIRKKMTNDQIIELHHKRQEGKEDEFINSLIQ